MLTMFGQALNVAIFLAVVSFYLLDFALNALQASLRNLLLDIAPSDQLSLGNAWHGRMTHAGNIIGTAIGRFARAQYGPCRLIYLLLQASHLSIKSQSFAFWVAISSASSAFLRLSF